MRKKYAVLFASMLLAAVIAANADAQFNDVYIDPDGNVETAVDGAANLEVSGNSAEDAIKGTATGTGAEGVTGTHSSGNTGYLGGQDIGVYGSSSTGHAGYFDGNVHINGSLTGAILNEIDPKVGLLTADKWCTADGTGGAILCTQEAPTDEVGTLVNGMWCRSNGVEINCQMTPPVASVSGGTGVTLGGTSRDVTVNVDFSGSGAADSSARSDHDHNALYYSEAQVDQIIAALTAEYEERIQSVETLLPRRWKTEQEIGTEEQQNATEVRVAVDSSGNAAAVWRQYDGARYNVWSNRYNATGGTWGTAELIETDTIGSAQDQKVAVGGSGNAVAVWEQHDGTRYNIWVNRYNVASEKWGIAELIENYDAGDANQPQVAVDSIGNAVAVWVEWDNTRGDIWSKRYNATTGTWGTAELIETDDTDTAWYPKVAVDGIGNAVAVWRQYDGTRYNLWSNRYIASSGTWGTAELIETDNEGSAFIPDVAVDGSGNAVAVWRQHDGMRFNVWSNRYNATSGAWGTAELVETDNAGSAHTPQVAVDISGNAVAVWEQSDGTRYNIWSNRYNAASGTWSAPELLENDNTGDAASPWVAMDGSGNAMAVWEQYDGARFNIWSNRYVASSGSWGTPELLETDASGSQVAMDGSGNAVAVWEQYDGTRYNIRSNRYNATSGTWGAPELLENDNAGDAGPPHISTDSSGNRFAVWHQYDGHRNSIFANIHKRGSGWGVAGPIEQDNSGDATSPWVAAYGAGNAVAVWKQNDGIYPKIWASLYTPANGWSTPEVIDADIAGSPHPPQVAVDENGNAVAVWDKDDGLARSIWSNRYDAAAGTWGTAELLETDDTGFAWYPRVAMDGSGNAVAVWQQEEGALLYSIWSNRYDAAAGSWGTAELIETDNAGSAYNPHVALDGHGNAVAVWWQEGAAPASIWSNRYNAASGNWGAAELIETDNAGIAVWPEVAVDRNGNAVAVWQQHDGVTDNIWSNRYIPGSGWGTPELIETDNAGDADSPHIATDGSGNAVAVWRQDDGTTQNIVANRATAGDSWGTAEQIETGSAGDAYSPDIAVDGSGNAVAVWQKYNGTRTTIFSNEYTKY